MPNREPTETTNLDTIYGSEPIPWSRPRDLLAVGALGSEDARFFLGTVRLTAHTVFGVASAEPHGATRWRF